MVNAFGPYFAIEGLDVGVVGRLSRPGEVQDDIIGVGPEIQGPRDELRPIIDSNGFGNSTLDRYSFQSGNHIRTGMARAYINCGRQLLEGIDDGQNADLATIEELIRQEVHRPDIVRPLRRSTVLTQLRCHSPLWSFVPYLKAFFRI